MGSDHLSGPGSPALFGKLRVDQLFAGGRLARDLMVRGLHAAMFLLSPPPPLRQTLWGLQL